MLLNIQLGIWYCLYVESKNTGAIELIYKTRRVTDVENGHGYWGG